MLIGLRKLNVKDGLNKYLQNNTVELLRLYIILILWRRSMNNFDKVFLSKRNKLL